MLASVWENYPVSSVTEEQIASIREIATFVRPFLRRQGYWIRFERHMGSKQPQTAAEDFQPQRILQSYAGREPQACLHPSSPKSFCKQLPVCFWQQPKPVSPTRAERPSNSRAGIMVMAVLRCPRRPGNTVVGKTCRNYCWFSAAL